MNDLANITGPLLDPLQSAYMLVDDAVNMVQDHDTLELGVQHHHL